jgi:hypothetical protein
VGVLRPLAQPVAHVVHDDHLREPREGPQLPGPPAVMAGTLDEAVATVRAFARRSGALRVVLLVDPGDGGQATMLECAPDGAVEVTDAGRTWGVAAGSPVDADPRALPDIRPAPASALSLDPDTGELEAPLGAVANLAHAVLGLARAFGGRSVATADFATRNPDLTLTIAAREGEPPVAAAGDRRFVLPV